MITIKLSNNELNIINQLIKESDTSIDFEIDQNIIIFKDVDSALIVDELIKDKLQIEGFSYDYSPNMIGRICEGLIDKFYEAIENS